MKYQGRENGTSQGCRDKEVLYASKCTTSNVCNIHTILDVVLCYVDVSEENSILSSKQYPE